MPGGEGGGAKISEVPTNDSIRAISEGKKQTHTHTHTHTHTLLILPSPTLSALAIACLEAIDLSAVASSYSPSFWLGCGFDDGAANAFRARYKSTMQVCHIRIYSRV